MNFKLQSSLKQLNDVLDSLEQAVVDVNHRLQRLNEEKAAQQTDLWSYSQKVHTLEAAQEDYDHLLAENQALQESLASLREPVTHILKAAKSLGTELET